MKNDKYYIPDISEFHVGFEYEFKSTFHDGTVKTQEQYDNDIKYPWIKSVVDSIEDLSYINRSLYGRNAELNRCGTRVKYLDKQDIEELGFQFANDEKYNGQVFYSTLPIYNEIDDNIQIILNVDMIKVCISIGKTSDLNKRHILYKGKCLNKSELSFILKRLNII